MESSVYIEVGPWTVYEDRRLTDYIQTHAGRSWKDVPQAAGLLRSYQSCHIRWLFHLSPATERRNLTETEEDMVAKLLSELDERLLEIVDRLPEKTYDDAMYFLSNYTDNIVLPLSIGFNPLTGSQWEWIGEKEKETPKKTREGSCNDLESFTFEKLFSYFAQILTDNDATQNERDATCIEQNDTNVGQPYSITIPPTPQDDFYSENKGVIQVDSSENNDTTPNDSDYDDDDQNNNKTSLDTTHISKTPGYITSKICISLEVLEQLFDMNMEDAAKSLNVSKSSLKRMCKENGIERWPCRKRRKINHQQCANPKNVNKLVQKNNDQINKSTMTQAKIVSPLENASSSSVIIKAFGDETVKFPLSVSSGVNELKEKIGKRLELEVGSFKLKYEDDDGDLVLINCDEDLHDCLGNSRLSTSIDHKTTFNIFVF